MEYTQEMKDLITKFRAEWKKHDDERDEDLPTEIPEVIRHNDISYGPYGKYNLLDLNLPKNYSGKLPVIINIHGGGFFYGSKETYQFYCMFLAKQGFAVVNFNYRLAPDYQFPANIEDIDHVYNWLFTNAEKYNFDLNNVFLMGDSAGGQMVTQMSAIYTNPEYRHMFGLRNPDFTIRAGATNCGGFITENYHKIPKEPKIMYAAGLYFATHQDTATVDLTKLEDYIPKQMLPLYVMTANKDFVREQSIMLDKFLTEHKIAHEFHEYGDADHERQHVFHINQKDELAKKCNLDEIRFFKEHMA